MAIKRNMVETERKLVCETNIETGRNRDTNSGRETN